MFFTAEIDFWSKIRRFAYDNFSYSTKKPRILSYFRNFTVKYVVFAVFFVILNKKRVLDFSSITGRNLINTIYFRNYSHKKYLFLTGAQKIFVLLTKIPPAKRQSFSIKQKAVSSFSA